MVKRVFWMAVVVLAIYALVHSPRAAAVNVRTAGAAAVHALGTVLARMAEFVEALVR